MWQALMARLLTEPVRETRAGPTHSAFGVVMSFDLQAGFPAVTTKKLYFDSVANELAGFLRAETDASRMGSQIWIDDARRWHAQEGSKSLHPDDMGNVYGVQWRQWRYGKRVFDQLANVVKTIKRDPTDRRMIVTAWNPGELDVMCLPPCHYAFQFYVHVEKRELSCMVHMRSVDCFLGLPFDIAEYALLTHIVGMQTGYTPNSLIMTLGDTHIYCNHKAAIDTVLARTPYQSPRLVLDPSASIDNFYGSMAELADYSCFPAVAAPLNVGQ